MDDPVVRWSDLIKGRYTVDANNEFSLFCSELSKKLLKFIIENTNKSQKLKIYIKRKVRAQQIHRAFVVFICI